MKKETTGQALSGVTVDGLLNLFRYEPPRYRIPINLKKRKKQK
jgi:hypothetical protein